MAFSIAYMTLAIDKIDGHDLSNVAHLEYLPRIL